MFPLAQSNLFMEIFFYVLLLFMAGPLYLIISRFTRNRIEDELHRFWVTMLLSVLGAFLLLVGFAYGLSAYMGSKY